MFLKPARAPTVLGLIIITLGFEMMLYGIASWVWGAETRAFPSPISDTRTFSFAGVIVSELNLVTFCVSVAVITCLAIFFKCTMLGIAMRAVSQNEYASKILGISTTRIYCMTWGVSSVIGAVAGMLLVPIVKLDPNMMLDPLLKGFTAAVVGGMNSLPGAIAGGCFLGLIENLGAAYISTEFKSPIAFFLIVIVLCVRPSGLFSIHYIKRV
jgi:branched-chain amino acid transport system permease protein